jgi:hypothetical protein
MTVEAYRTKHFQTIILLEKKKKKAIKFAMHQIESDTKRKQRPFQYRKPLSPSLSHAKKPPIREEEEEEEEEEEVVSLVD